MPCPKLSLLPHPQKHARPVVAHLIGKRNGKRFGMRFYTAQKGVVVISKSLPI